VFAHFKRRDDGDVPVFPIDPPPGENRDKEFHLDIRINSCQKRSMKYPRGGNMDLIHHTKEVYEDFFQSAHQDGALDAKTKKLIHLALVLAMRCEP
jgi:alkylhydroperoxidase/carboxymuconolactone decarboxylase family protein YurZ